MFVSIKVLLKIVKKIKVDFVWMGCRLGKVDFNNM